MVSESLTSANPIATSALSTADELQRSLALLRATFESTADGIVAVDREGRITHYNRKFVEMWEIPEGLMESRDFHPILAFILEQLQNPEKFCRQIKALSENTNIDYHTVLEFRDGRVFEYHSLPSKVGQEIVGRVWNFSDITERKHSEEQLCSSLKELTDFKCALDRSAIVAITDARGIITYINDKFCELSQYEREELIGKDHRVINSGYHSREFFKNLWGTIAQGKVWKGEIKNKAKDGSDYWVDTTIVPFLDENGKPFQYLAIRFDITQRKETESALRRSQKQLQAQTEQLKKTLGDLKRTQAQLVHSEKMSSLGQLVAGVAHEINNPVSFIYGNLSHATLYMEELLHLLQLYREHYPTPVPAIQEAAEEIEIEFLMQDVPSLLDSMKLGAERIRNIVRSLRNFSRLDEAQMKSVNLHEGIESTLLVLQNRLKAIPGRPIEIIKNYGNIPEIECYAGQLNQVFMNLLSNAIDALENQPEPRRISIKTEVAIDPPQNLELPNSPTSSAGTNSQPFVAIEIADNGPGISPADLQRLFDPFFTTKPVGKGTGLGLAISYQIVVEKHGGRLKCDSEPGRGAAFTIEIPLTQNTH
jgi:hypothetical protein